MTFIDCVQPPLSEIPGSAPGALIHLIVLSSGPKISKSPLKRGHWWLKNKERKFHFWFVKRRFLAAINCTRSAFGALVPGPVLLRITHWPKSRLPISPPDLFLPWYDLPLCTHYGWHIWHSRYQGHDWNENFSTVTKSSLMSLYSNQK